MDGGGTGTVTPTPVGPTYTPNSVVTLTATPTAGATFAGWTGACTGTSPTCQVTMSADRIARATFAVQGPPPSYGLSIGTSGAGQGSVSTDKPGATYTAGTVVQLTATPDAVSTFTDWSGACAGTTPTCQVTMDAAKSVTAQFGKAPPPPSYTLTYGRDDGSNGPGSVSADKPGATFPVGTVVTLTARPGPDSIFIGWKGDGCVADGPNIATCKVTMSSNRLITANFAKGSEQFSTTVVNN
jgi:uncharacterized repeat protein (TIGR02543 family)